MLNFNSDGKKFQFRPASQALTVPERTWDLKEEYAISLMNLAHNKTQKSVYVALNRLPKVAFFSIAADISNVKEEVITGQKSVYRILNRYNMAGGAFSITLDL
jgi:hypothetical protein